MQKLNDNAPSFELPNNLTPDNSPVGYPDMSGRNPESYAKLNPKKREYVYHSGVLSHSINSERRGKKESYAQMSELQRMKLAK